MTLEQYNMLGQDVRDIIETYEIEVQCILDDNRIKAKCACRSLIRTRYISKFLEEDIYCASCSQLKHGLDVLKTYAIQRNGECLSTGNYLGSKAHYLWKCNNCEYSWMSTWSSIHNMNTWCPSCSGSISENICRHALEEITGHKFAKISNFAKTSTTRGFEIDCYNKELKIGVEYDGIQHHKYVPLFHGAKDSGKFEAQQDRDNNKTKICSDMGITLLRVKYTIPRNELRTHIHDLIRGLNLPIELNDSAKFISNIEFNNKVSKICSSKSSEYIERIMSIVKDNNAVLNSTSCDSWKSPIEITCAKGHNFTTNLDRLCRTPTRWCPDCANNRALKEDHIRAILEPKGFELIRVERRLDNIGRKRVYITYICDTFHEVTVQWDNHSGINDRCPDCVAEDLVDQIDANAIMREENRPLTLKEEAYAYVLSIGYDMDEYNNAVDDLTEIKCLAHNHTFYAKPHTLINTNNRDKEHCAQCVLRNDFPNLLVIDHANITFRGCDKVRTTCIECNHSCIGTNKSISERTQCCKNLTCRYNDKTKKYTLKRSRNKRLNTMRSIEDLNTIIANHNNIQQNEQHELLRAHQVGYQNHPNYIIPVFTNKSAPIELECRLYNHKFTSKIKTLEKFPERELCAQCIIKNDFPYHRIVNDIDFTDKNIESKHIRVLCKCGTTKSIVHKSIRNKTTNFCGNKCPYYGKIVRNINKSDNIPKSAAI